jgi:hypothetical protein
MTKHDDTPSPAPAGLTDGEVERLAGSGLKAADDWNAECPFAVGAERRRGRAVAAARAVATAVVGGGEIDEPAIYGAASDGEEYARNLAAEVETAAGVGPSVIGDRVRRAAYRAIGAAFNRGVELGKGSLPSHPPGGSGEGVP